jgi:hypothetical protein
VRVFIAYFKIYVFKTVFIVHRYYFLLNLEARAKGGVLRSKRSFFTVRPVLLAGSRVRLVNRKCKGVSCETQNIEWVELRKWANRPNGPQLGH